MALIVLQSLEKDYDYKSSNGIKVLATMTIEDDIRLRETIEQEMGTLPSDTWLVLIYLQDKKG